MRQSYLELEECRGVEVRLPVKWCGGSQDLLGRRCKEVCSVFFSVPRINTRKDGKVRELTIGYTVNVRYCPACKWEKEKKNTQGEQKINRNKEKKSSNENQQVVYYELLR